MYNSSLAVDVNKTALDMVFDGEIGYINTPGLATATNSAIFNQSTTDKAAEIISQFMGPGYFEQRTEMQDVPSATARVGNPKTFNVVNYDKQVLISKFLMDDDQHSTIDKLVRAFKKRAVMTQDKEAFRNFSLGFTTVLTNDGVALFSDSHITLSGDTVDNLETGALNEANLDIAIQSLLNQKTQDGTLGGHIPAILLVPPRLFKTAQEVTKSTLRSGTANNDLNYYSEIYPGLQVFQSQFLGVSFGGSDTAWFLLSNDHSMYRWVRETLHTDLIDWRISPNNNYVYKAGFREMTGPISFEGVVASTGLTA